MDLKNAIELFYTSSDRVDYYWRFSVTVTVVVIGWLVTISENKDGLDFTIKSVVTITYLIALIMSLKALLKEYEMFSAFLHLCKIKAEESEENDIGPLKNAVISLHYRKRKLVAIVIHAIYAMIVLVLVWTSLLFVK